MSSSHSTIQRVLTGFLLVLFAFSITPKQVLHDITVNHKDTHEKLSAHDFHSTLQKSGYHCNTEDLVVESPFIENDHSVEVSGISAHSQFFSEHPRSFYYHHQFFFELRGPPAII
jgi:hypothetical protein